ncbi:hypothetical protein ACLI4Z_18540, partial [Natrialbaceae archaeon A-arb3/5]
MPKIPENTEELTDYILDDVLYGLELNPVDSKRLLTYMRDRHEHLFGPHSTYFVLGERVIESVTYEAAGCGKCVQHNRNPA